MFFVYILKSLKDNNFYIGSTSDLVARIERHNQGREKATKARKPFRLVYTEEYEQKTDALKREKYIKRQKSAIYIKNLIKEWRGGSSTG